jgi:hypothetical protein
LACALALRDWAMNMVARHWHNETVREYCAGWYRVYNPNVSLHYEFVERVEPPLPTFDKKHFYAIVFPKKKDGDTKQAHKKNPAKHEEWNAQWMQECEAKYEAWCERVLADLEENAEFNSEAQMDKFKSRMLRGMETMVESSGKSATQEQVKSIQEQVKSIIQEQVKIPQEQVDSIQEQGKAFQEQVKALSDAMQSQQAEIRQMHASMQLILQKLNP